MTMKLQFDAQLPYQEQAVAAVVDLFQGQAPKQANFMVAASSANSPGLFDSDYGIGNRLELLPEELLQNLNAVQLRNGLAPSMEWAEKIKGCPYDFDIEMETGTGKTYVYLRSILELNKAYGFTKFIIVVPSIAIKEGVFKNLQITKAHFDNLYNHMIYDYFVYDGNKPDQVRDFAVSDTVQIMIINIDAFRKSFENPDDEKKANLIHRANDKLNGLKPIELIQATHPMVVIDEPQSVDTTPKAKEAIASLHPLAIFRYSATHVEKHNLVYKLDAVDSYNLQLVKEIEVASFAAKDSHNQAYLLLKSVNNKKMPITARIEMDVRGKDNVQRKSVTVRQGDDLYEKSKGREVYRDYIVNDIYCEAGNEYVDFTNKPGCLRIGQPVGNLDDLVLKEQQIRQTIEEHLDKELILNPKGIKVLSLFFIDRVANYRYYDEDGKEQPGPYAKIFERCYREIVRRPKYHSLFHELHHEEDDVSKVHGGYFSIDKKKHVVDTTGVSAVDETEYNIIMKDKEYLLSFECPMRFIFSHSALREGWDNPNVFQICTLNETHSEIKKRQEIGRGLRLCVDQQGARQHGFMMNRLTVMANESYEEFAAQLQREYEEDGFRFGMLEMHSFANIPVKQANGDMAPLGMDGSKAIYQAFQDQGYISAKGKVLEPLKAALQEHTLVVPPTLRPLQPAIEAVCKKVSSVPKVRNAAERKPVQLNKAIYLSEDFRALWDKIKWKTTYRVDFDTDMLIKRCCDRIQLELTVNSAKLIYQKAKVGVHEVGIDTTEIDHRTVYAVEENVALPDIVTYLQNETNLTRRTIVKLLQQADRMFLFRKNPQAFMDGVAKIIKSVMQQQIVDGIKYTKIGEDAYYAQELFDTQELNGYLERNMMESQRSVYNYVVYDSQNEKDFAQQFESNPNVELYAKLPDWFKIATPLGSYNPDWAVLINVHGETKLYFVLETKGNLALDDLRPRETAKIVCGRKHFAALGNQAEFVCDDNAEDFIEGHTVPLL